MICNFREGNRWLSNFAFVKIKLNNIVYPTVEHAYMSAKNDDINWKAFCADRMNSASQVKKAGRTIQLINNWEIKKLLIMEEYIRQKFNQEPCKTKLLNTHDEHIQEGNYWGDAFWGVSLKTNKGHNHLGQLIMQIRVELNNENK